MKLLFENWREYLNEEDIYYVDAISENDEYCPVCAAALEEEKKPCKPSKGKRFANELMVSVALLVKLVKQKVVGIEFDPEQQRVTPTALDLQKSRNVKTPLVRIRSLGKNGNVRGINRYHETPT